jgi:hypothetical protein
MHPRTTEALQELEQADWFSRVGVKDTDGAIVLSSWQEAIRYCSMARWQDLCIEAANQYCERLSDRSPQHFQQWNRIVLELKPLVEPFVRKKTETVVRAHKLPAIFEESVQWDILHLCMESEYADVYPPGFYASQAYWYAKGHFPCGWKGKFPEGKLIIY